MSESLNEGRRGIGVPAVRYRSEGVTPVRVGSTIQLAGLGELPSDMMESVGAFLPGRDAFALSAVRRDNVPALLDVLERVEPALADIQLRLEQDPRDQIAGEDDLPAEDAAERRQVATELRLEDLEEIGRHLRAIQRDLEHVRVRLIPLEAAVATATFERDYGISVARFESEAMLLAQEMSVADQLVARQAVAIAAVEQEAADQAGAAVAALDVELPGLD